MRNITGLILIGCGAWLLWSGRAHHAAALASRAAGRAAAVRPSLAGFGAALRPVVFVALGYLALKASLAYAVLDGGRLFSALDLGGFLFLLAAYGRWLHLRTSVWDPAAPVASSDKPEAGEIRPPRPRETGPGARHLAGMGRVAAVPLAPAAAERDRAA